MNSTYVTFGEFNKPPEPPAPPPHQPMSMNESFHMGGGYDQGGFTQAPSPQSVRYPIRQHMTQPRNPYNPSMLPPYQRTEMPGSNYLSQSSPMMMPPPPPPPLSMPFARGGNESRPLQIDFDTPSTSITPIGQALSSETFEMSSKDSFEPPTRQSRILDATCVDINDHIVNCPICSKYYQNHTTVYVGIIILLGFIILIFLLKSIMEVKR